jgi:spore germination protein GerM
MREKKIVIAGIALVLVTVIVFYYWFASERERHLAVQQTGVEPLDVESTVLEEQSTGELEVSLYFHRPGAVSPDRGFLRTETRTIHQTEDPVLIARQIVNELLTGPETDEDKAEKPVEDPFYQRGLFANQAGLRNLYILNDGTAVVDLTSGTTQSLVGGITHELAVIHSITRSLRENIPEVKRVRFLVEGKTTETLAGHVSITEPFR